MKYKAKVKWHGNHYFSGEEVIGSKIKKEDGRTYLFDDSDGIDEFPIFGNSRNVWVEIDKDSLEDISND